MGVLFKVALPDMPFQFRMGYIFIILFIIYAAITYVDNSRIASEKANEGDRIKMLKWARITLFFAAFFILAAAIHKILLISGSSNEWVIYLENIGFEAFFFFDRLSSRSHSSFSLTLMMFMKTKWLYHLDLQLFKTDKGFALGAFGITFLVTLLYIFLW